MKLGLPVRNPVLLFFDWLYGKGWWIDVEMPRWKRAVYDWLWTFIVLQIPLYMIVWSLQQLFGFGL